MIQNVLSTMSDATCIGEQCSPRLWGLSPRELHDAFWRSKGVQCVRREEKAQLQRHAELFLLLEPDQLVLFNIADMSDRLTWHNASVTRLRLVNEDAARYSEHVVIDNDGFVSRIERRYRPRVASSSRVMMTSSRRLASIWMNAKTRHEGWDRLRRSVAWSRVDHQKCAGITFLEGNPEQERQMIDDLVGRWRSPNQVILGLKEVEPQIWRSNGEDFGYGSVCIGPMWIGHRTERVDAAVLVGPAWMEDQIEVAEQNDIDRVGLNRLREFIDIESPQQARAFRGPVGANRLYALCKRGFDVVASLLGLLVLSPLLAAIAICIILEDGWPPHFGHVRQGRGGKLFKCWKFRTMTRDPKRHRIDQSENVCDGPQVYIKNDPRVTRIGRILRTTNLDELLQLWNVLIGEMSLVGPRPSPDDENQYCPAWRDIRLSVRPGITGLWQLKRTREPGEDFQEWIKYDIEYVQKANLLFDLAILVKTLKLLFMGRMKSAIE